MHKNKYAHEWATRAVLVFGLPAAEWATRDGAAMNGPPRLVWATRDTSRTISCAGTLGLYCIERIISYEIRSGLTAITDPINMRENVPSTTDSCHNIVTTGSGGFVNVNASPGIFNQFEDHLLDCPFSFALACSFTFSNQQWQQRNANLTYSSIGTVGPVSVTSFSNANVANNSTSLTGQTFR